MNRRSTAVWLHLLGLLLLTAPGRAQENPPAAVPASARAEAEAFFESRVRPLLAKRCFQCHGAETQEGGLRLDSRQHLLAGADGQPVVVAGNPDQSRLVAAVRRQGELQMPPDDPLPEADIETLVTWVKLGLPWPKSETPEAPTLTRQQRYDMAVQEHWAFQPIQRPAMPVVANAAWARNPLDRFVLFQLEQANLTPSPQADRRTLIRRATFDLLGLPPTPEEVAAFVDDPGQDAYGRLIDRLLASPRYGERWGRHWMDVARYADTKGYSFGQERRYPYSYTYRDYVIGAWNRDLPYDRFLLEQLAANSTTGTTISTTRSTSSAAA
jgi:mono/diheme cytochrome c family protein